MNCQMCQSHKGVIRHNHRKQLLCWPCFWLVETGKAPDGYLCLSESAKHLCTSQQRIQQMIARHDLPYIQIYNRAYVPPVTMTWLKERWGL